MRLTRKRRFSSGLYARKLPVFSSAVSLLLLLSCLCFAQNGKVEILGPLTDSTVPERVRQILEPKGYRLLLDDGTPICELWLRKSIPGQPKSNSPDILYSNFAESTLVGLLHFAKPGSDYRGQAIPAGFYTLRYELIPNDGNHLGAAPNRDFLLLIPAYSDPDPDAVFKFQELTALSRSAVKSKHPAPLSLIQPEVSGTAPATSKDDQDHWIFSAGMKLASGEELPFALVVRGTTQQ
jgi:hypothetical protein